MARVFRRKDSRTWYAWIPDDTGRLRRISTKCTDRRAAEIRAAQLEREHVDPAAAVARKTQIGRIFDDYIKSRRRMNRAQETIGFYTKKFANLLSLLPERTASISHETMLEYIDKRREEGARNTTIKKELRAFGGAWKLARRSRLVRVPLDEIMPELEDDYEPRERFATPWELVGLATVLPPHRMAQVAYMAAAGCDWSAVGRARPEDSSKDLRECRIRGSKRKGRDRPAVLALPDQRALLKWALANADGGVGGRLFTAWPNVRNDIAKACVRLGIPRLSPNDFRRTYGSWLRGEGAEPSVIGAAMGHKDSRMVERVYGRLPPDKVRKLLLAQTGGEEPQ